MPVGVNWKIVAALGVLALAAFAGWHYKSTLEENRRLEAALETANSTIMGLDEAAKRKEKINATEREQNDEIDAAPAADDGPIAPVLRRTIERMR